MIYLNPKDHCQKLIATTFLDILPGFAESDIGAIRLKADIDGLAANGDVQAVKDGLFALRKIAGDAELAERTLNLRVDVLVDELLDNPPDDQESIMEVEAKATLRHAKVEAESADEPMPEIAEDSGPDLGAEAIPGESETNEKKQNQEQPKIKSNRKNRTPKIDEFISTVIKSFGRPPQGLFIGIKAVDDRFGRILQPGDTTLIASRPSMGKTSVAVQIAEYQSARGLNVLFWSLEMSKEKLATRLISKNSGVSVKNIINGDILYEEWPLITKAGDHIQKLNLFVNDLSAATVAQIKEETTTLDAELKATTGKGIGLIIVDYLQLARGESKERVTEISEVSEAMRQLAKDLYLPVAILAQLNRELEKRADKRPMLSDLRDSGKIEQDAATIVFIYRETIYCDDCRSAVTKCTKNHEKDAELLVYKNREGEPGAVSVVFDGARQTWCDRDDYVSPPTRTSRKDSKKEQDRLDREAVTERKRKEYSDNLEREAQAAQAEKAQAEEKAAQETQLELGAMHPKGSAADEVDQRRAAIPKAFANVQYNHKFDNLAKRGVIV